MKKTFLLLLVLFLFSCEDKDSVKKEFPLTYKAVINDNKGILKRVSFYTNTYFPDENITIINAYGKSKHKWASSEDYLEDFDSLFYTPDKKCYNGCTKYMEITFHYTDSLNIKPKTYITEGVISNERTVHFSWPEDTLK